MIACSDRGIEPGALLRDMFVRVHEPASQAVYFGRNRNSLIVSRTHAIAGWSAVRLDTDDALPSIQLINGSVERLEVC